MFNSLYSFLKGCSIKALCALRLVLRHKKFTLIGFSAVFAATLLLIRFVGHEFIPEEDTGDVRLTIELPLGTRLEESDKVARRIEEMLKNDVPEARFYFARTGEVPGRARGMGQVSGMNIITSGAKLVPKTERKRSVFAVARPAQQIAHPRVARST
jgi:HAE1 family hydrophobic/amphiphilic exporter-1